MLPLACIVWALTCAAIQQYEIRTTGSGGWRTLVAVIIPLVGSLAYVSH
jgi:hypothetical protein